MANNPLPRANDHRRKVNQSSRRDRRHAARTTQLDASQNETLLETPRGLLYGATLNDTFSIDIRDEDYRSIFANFTGVTSSILQVQFVKPSVLKDIGRSRRKVLIRRLARTNVMIIVQGKNADGKLPFLRKPRILTRRRSDLATVMILGLALRGHQHWVAELVGLSPPNVLKSIETFCRPPFMNGVFISKLAHVAARNVLVSRRGHDHAANHRRDKPTTIRFVANIIASLLKSNITLDMEDTQAMYLSYFGDFFAQENRQPQERGFEIGLFLAGILIFIRRCREKIEKNSRIYRTGCQFTFNLIKIIPILGPALSAFQPIADHALESRKLRKQTELDNLEDRILEEYWEERHSAETVIDDDFMKNLTDVLEYNKLRTRAIGGT